MKKIMKNILTLSVLALSLPVLAAEPSMNHSGMDMSSMSGMDMKMDMPKAKSKVVVKPKTHARPVSKKTPQKIPSMAMSKMDMSKMDHGSMNMGKGSMDMSKMDHGSMDMSKGSMDMSKMDHGSMDMGKGSMDMSKMDHGSMDMGKGSMDISKMDHGSMDMSKGSMDMSKMDHGSMDMGGMQMGKMQGGSAPADARSPDYSQGRDFGPIAPPAMMGNGIMMSVMFNQLEVAHSQGKTEGGYDIDAWVGSDWNRLALKAEGDTSNSKLEEARTELLWRKPVDIFWNTELGVRQDSGKVKGRTWLALGLNGISPYWLDLGGTVYVSDENRAALRLEATYDWRITQRLILQPTIETNIYSKDDPERDVGKGFSDLQAGLRLRYDITRQFAPYVGVETVHQYGKTAELLRANNEPTSKTVAVAGVRLWF
jgi:copper resistance protein B